MFQQQSFCPRDSTAEGRCEPKKRSKCVCNAAGPDIKSTVSSQADRLWRVRGAGNAGSSTGEDFVIRQTYRSGFVCAGQHFKSLRAPKDKEKKYIKKNCRAGRFEAEGGHNRRPRDGRTDVFALGRSGAGLSGAGGDSDWGWQARRPGGVGDGWWVRRAGPGGRKVQLHGMQSGGVLRAMAT